MAKYIVLINWTEHGIKNVKDSPKRLDAARALCKKHGCAMTKFYLTMGAHDMVAIVEGPDDEAMAKVALGLGSSGAIRTTTLRAFSEATYRKLIDAI